MNGARGQPLVNFFPTGRDFNARLTFLVDTNVGVVVWSKRWPANLIKIAVTFTSRLLVLLLFKSVVKLPLPCSEVDQTNPEVESINSNITFGLC